MSDILRGLASRASLIAWTLPSAIAAGAFALLVLPHIDHLPVFRDIASLDSVAQAGVLAFTVVALAFLLDAFSTPLYRVLEGYLGWPQWLQNWRVTKQTARKESIKTAIKSASGWQQGLLYERLSRFPDADDQIVPTRLGNALRAFETYAHNHFSLDSQSVWSELFASVPKSLQQEYESSRAGVDFFVAVFYLAALFGLIAFAVALTTGPLILLVGAAISFALLPIAYRLAYQNTSYWADTTRAVVNLGRKGLADNFGLVLPDSIQEERKMWQAVNAFIFYPYEKALAEALDEFRGGSDH